MSSRDFNEFMKMWAHLLGKGGDYMNVNKSQWLMQYKNKFMKADWTSILESINEKVKREYGVEHNTFKVKGSKIVVVEREAFVKRNDELGALPSHGPAPITVFEKMWSPKVQAAASGVSAAREEESEGEKDEEEEEASGAMVWPDTWSIKQMKVSGQIIALSRFAKLIARLYFDRFVRAEEVEAWLRDKGMEVRDLWPGCQNKERKKTLVTVAFRSLDSKERCMAIPLRDRKEFGCTGVSPYRPDEKQRRIYFYNNYVCRLSQEQVEAVAREFANGREFFVQPIKYVDLRGEEWVKTPARTAFLRIGYIYFADTARADDLLRALELDSHPKHRATKVLKDLGRFGIPTPIAFAPYEDPAAS